MAYIGRDTDKISNVEVLDNITFDGSSSYTLQKNSVNFIPSSANTLLVSIDGVVQAGNFTVSGSTIDFGTAVAGTSTCDFILHYGVGLITTPSDGTVTTAKLGDSAVTNAKVNDDLISGATELASEPADTDEFLVSDAGTLKRIDYSLIKGGGITMADQFCLTSSFGGNAHPISSNLSRVARTGQGTINGGMTESSGIFTFPSTGIYLVNFTASFQYNGDSRYIFITMQATTDNSTYSAVAETPTFIQETSGSTTYAQAQCSSLIDVTDTSNVKVRFFVSPLNASVTTRGEAVSATYMQFIRLGDT
jgi:hypothetical protein